MAFLRLSRKRTMNNKLAPLAQWMSSEVNINAFEEQVPQDKKHSEIFSFNIEVQHNYDALSRAIHLTLRMYHKWC